MPLSAIEFTEKFKLCPKEATEWINDNTSELPKLFSSFEDINNFVIAYQNKLSEYISQEKGTGNWDIYLNNPTINNLYNFSMLTCCPHYKPVLVLLKHMADNILPFYSSYPLFINLVTTNETFASQFFDAKWDELSDLITTSQQLIELIRLSSNIASKILKNKPHSIFSLLKKYEDFKGLVEAAPDFAEKLALKDKGDSIIKLISCDDELIDLLKLNPSIVRSIADENSSWLAHSIKSYDDFISIAKSEYSSIGSLGIASQLINKEPRNIAPLFTQAYHYIELAGLSDIDAINLIKACPVHASSCFETYKDFMKLHEKSQLTASQLYQASPFQIKSLFNTENAQNELRTKDSVLALQMGFVDKSIAKYFNQDPIYSNSTFKPNLSSQLSLYAPNTRKPPKSPPRAVLNNNNYYCWNVFFTSILVSGVVTLLAGLIVLNPITIAVAGLAIIAAIGLLFAGQFIFNNSQTNSLNEHSDISDLEFSY